MLDPCSTGSYITESAAEELQLEGHVQNLTISGTAGTEVKKLSRRVELSVGDVNGRFQAKLEANVLNDITGNTPAIKWSEIKHQWPHLERIPFQTIAKRPQIDVLIGSDHPVFHQVRREISGSKANDPVARQTNLGWVCFGPAVIHNQECSSRSHHSIRTYRSANVDVQETNDLLRKFWELESIGIRDGDKQVRCFCKYDSKTTIDPITASCGVTLTPQSPPMCTSSNVYRSVIRRLPFVPNTFFSPMRDRRRRNIQKLLIRLKTRCM